MNSVSTYRKSADIDQLNHAMDYSYFTAVPEHHHQFLGLPPTPDHTNGANTDEFTNGSPPVSLPYLMVRSSTLKVTHRILTTSKFSMPTTTSMAVAFQSPQLLNPRTSR
jgi:hypothetical protein